MAMEEPQSFSALDLRKSAPWLSKGQFETLVDLQAGIGRSDAKAMESQRVLKSTLDLIKSEVTSIGIDLTPKEGTDKAKQTAQFLGALTQALDQATATKGAPLTPEESRRIGMSMLQEGIQQGTGIFGMFQTKKRGFEIATDPNIPAGASFVLKRFSDIPASVRNDLIVAYRTRNNIGTRTLTAADEAAIERAYTLGVQQGRIK
jgi:hypothetical protein